MGAHLAQPRRWGTGLAALAGTLDPGAHGAMAPASALLSESIPRLVSAAPARERAHRQYICLFKSQHFRPSALKYGGYGLFAFLSSLCCFHELLPRTPLRFCLANDSQLTHKKVRSQNIL